LLKSLQESLRHNPNSLQNASRLGIATVATTVTVIATATAATTGLLAMVIAMETATVIVIAIVTAGMETVTGLSHGRKSAMPPEMGTG